jgi:uncharacterized membrane protein YecN with MAPEG domain
MPNPVVTTTFLLPFTLYLLLLQARVVYYRATTNTNLGDRLNSTRKEGKDPMDAVNPDPLYLAARCHQNYVENVPMAMILAMSVEMAGAEPKVLAGLMGGWWAMRVAHVYVFSSFSPIVLDFECFSHQIGGLSWVDGFTSLGLKFMVPVLMRRDSELGLRGKDSNGVARPMSFMGTQLLMAGLAGWGVWLVKDDFKAKMGI